MMAEKAQKIKNTSPFGTRRESIELDEILVKIDVDSVSYDDFKEAL